MWQWSSERSDRRWCLWWHRGVQLEANLALCAECRRSQHFSPFRNFLVWLQYRLSAENYKNKGSKHYTHVPDSFRPSKRDKTRRCVVSHLRTIHLLAVFVFVRNLRVRNDGSTGRVARCSSNDVRVGLVLQVPVSDSHIRTSGQEERVAIGEAQIQAIRRMPWCLGKKWKKNKNTVNASTLWRLCHLKQACNWHKRHLCRSRR